MNQHVASSFAFGIKDILPLFSGSTTRFGLYNVISFTMKFSFPSDPAGPVKRNICNSGGTVKIYLKHSSYSLHHCFASSFVCNESTDTPTGE